MDPLVAAGWLMLLEVVDASVSTGWDGLQRLRLDSPFSCCWGWDWFWDCDWAV